MVSSHLCYFPQILKDRNLNQYDNDYQNLRQENDSYCW